MGVEGRRLSLGGVRGEGEGEERSEGIPSVCGARAQECYEADVEMLVHTLKTL
jgi:hypothetical protein